MRRVAVSLTIAGALAKHSGQDEAAHANNRRDDLVAR
jgi:hypothetical protein